MGLEAAVTPTTLKELNIKSGNFVLLAPDADAASERRTQAVRLVSFPAFSVAAAASPPAARVVYCSPLLLHNLRAGGGVEGDGATTRALTLSVLAPVAISPESPQTAPELPRRFTHQRRSTARRALPVGGVSAFGGGVTMGGADALAALRRHFKSRRRALQVGDLFYVSMGKLPKADEEAAAELTEKKAEPKKQQQQRAGQPSGQRPKPRMPLMATAPAVRRRGRRRRRRGRRRRRA